MATKSQQNQAVILKKWEQVMNKLIKAFYWVGLIDNGKRNYFRWCDFFRVKVG